MLTEKRLMYVEWFYDAQDDPYDDKSVYKCAYNAFIYAKGLKPDEAKNKYPWIVNPSTEEDKFMSEDMSMITAKLLEESTDYELDVIANIADGGYYFPPTTYFDPNAENYNLFI